MFTVAFSSNDIKILEGVCLRNRSGVVIRQNDTVLLIKRIRENRVYYVLPGGGVKWGESFEQAAIREAWEELGILVELNDQIVRIEYEGIQIYYEASILSGNIKLENGILDGSDANERGAYVLVWKKRSELSQLQLYPEEMRTLL